MATTAQENLDQAVRAAEAEGVDRETMRTLTKGAHESTMGGEGPTQEATVISQDIPVGTEFEQDFSSMSEEEPIEDNITAAFSQSTTIDNPFIKQVVGEKVNDPVIYQSKLNKITAYEMQLNGKDFKSARARAKAALQQRTWILLCRATNPK